MKEFYYSILDDYLDKSDAYNDIKTIKIYEIENEAQGNVVAFKAITYLRTALIGFKGAVKIDALNERKIGNWNDIEAKLKEHEHKRGTMVDIAPIKWN